MDIDFHGLVHDMVVNFIWLWQNTDAKGHAAIVICGLAFIASSLKAGMR